MPDFIGVETEKAIRNWGRGVTPRELIKAYGEVKKASIKAIKETSNYLSDKVYPSLITALDEIIEGKHDSYFSLPLKQGGAGTSLHMNMNEVISFLVEEYRGITLDSIEDINRYQSTNDTFNTAVTIVFLRHVTAIESLVIELQELLVEREGLYSDILITGRTEMQSALPLTLGQVFSSYAGAIERDRWRFNKIKERIRPSVLGGTAMGTCFSATSDYLFSAERYLREITGLSLPRSQNLTSDISMTDKFSEAAGIYDVLSNNLYKIASDFTIYTSTGEFIHPHLQYGSSIMPTKVNPVLLEFVRGLSIGISGECRKILDYGREGQLQLNAFLPFILEAGISIFHDMERALDSLMLFISSMKVNTGIVEERLLESGVIINGLRPYCDYSKLKALHITLQEKPVGGLEEMIDLIERETGLNREFLEDYICPGGFTSFLKREDR